MARITDEIMDHWHTVNADGEGYGIGEEREAPAAAATREGWTIVAHGVEGAVLCQQPNGTYTLVCNANGPWCVDIPAEMVEA